MNTKEHTEPVLKGFFEIPGYPDIYIHRSGTVYDDRFKEFLIITPGEMRPYPKVHPKGTADYLRGDILIHRALALTFLPVPSNMDDYQVDHINMNKNDYRLENLEWVPRGENCRRAHAGFAHVAHPVLVKNLITGAVMEFKSITQCAKHFGKHASQVAQFLSSPRMKPFDQKYDIVYKGRSWSALTKDDVDKMRKGQDREVVVVDKDTKITTIYRNTILAAEALGVCRTTLFKVLKRGKQLQGSKRAMYLSEFDGELKTAIRLSENSSNNPDRKGVSWSGEVTVHDFMFDVETQWQDIGAFAFSLGVERNSLIKALRANNGVYKHYKVKFLSSPDRQ